MAALAIKLWKSYLIQRNDTRQQLRRERLSHGGKLGQWRRWNRDTAILAQMPMVERIARDVRHMFARHLDIRDLVQAGNLGLVKAANSYHPSKGDFERYSYFVVRGAIIDSQKRRAYREEQNDSLQAIASAYDGWLPPRLDTDPAPRVDDALAAQQIRPDITRAVAALTGSHATVFVMYADGVAPIEIGRTLGISLSSTRVLIKEARQFIAHRLAAGGTERWSD